MSSSFAHTETPKIAGTWAVALSTDVTGTERATGKTTITTTDVAALATIDQQADELTLNVHLCRILLPDVEGISAVIADDVVQTVSLDISGDVRLEADGAATFETDTASALLGVRDVAEHEDLPKEADDPRVIDTDSDNAPGVSIAVGPGRVFIGLRFNLQLLGLVAEDSQRIAGEADLDLETAIYGDSIWLVDAAESAAEHSATHDFTASSRFEMLRESGDASCLEAIALLAP